MGRLEVGAAGPLTGFTLGITAVRRRREFGIALERRGARVVYAPAMTIVDPVRDDELQATTRARLAGPVDVVVATTARGLRAWFDAAAGWGLGAAMRDWLSAAHLVARGPKIAAVFGAHGLRPAFTPAHDSATEVIDHLLHRGVRRRSVAVQLHGEPLPDLVDALRAAGAEVLEVAVLRWEAPADPEPLRRLVQATATVRLDAVAFTSAPAVASFLATAKGAGCHDEVLAALRDRVLAACVGPVTAAALQRADVPVVLPRRSRLGALVREIAEQVPARCGHQVAAAGHRLDVRGHVVLVDGVPIPLSHDGLGLLRVLARQPGRIVRAADLAAACGLRRGVGAEVDRLRASLGDSRIVQSVPRGYRLAFDPERAASCADQHP